MGMKYSAYYDSEKKNDYNNNDYKNNMVEDIFVSIPELEKYLLSFLVKIGRDVASGSNNSGV
jgi:hypothetical protein